MSKGQIFTEIQQVKEGLKDHFTSHHRLVSGDITQQRRTKAELEQSMERLNSFDQHGTDRNDR